MPLVGSDSAKAPLIKSFIHPAKAGGNSTKVHQAQDNSKVCN
jgi:hypothetical protein